MAYSITIAGVDRTTDVIAQSVSIEDIVNDQVNTCSLALVNRNAVGVPDVEDEIIITNSDDTIAFGGYIVNSTMTQKASSPVIIQLECVDYTRLLDRNLVHRTYENMTDKEIIEDFVSRYCPGFGITTVNVISGVTIDQISFNYIQVSAAIRRICELTGRSWYIDYDKDIHYFPTTTEVAPFNIDSTNNEYTNLQVRTDNSQLKNRVYVRGGTKLSDETTFSSKGDGIMRKFVLPDRPHDVTVKVGGVTKTLGIKNINTSGFDWYLNYNEKYVEQDSGGSVLTTSDELTVYYKYDIPILVAVEDTASILDNGQKEYAIFDKSITTTKAARDRASAELTDYAASLIEGSFQTRSTGFRSGQYIHITLAGMGLDADYLVQKVKSKSVGAGSFVYTVEIASAKTLGIVKFLIRLLEANKNLIELDQNEVVDELLSITDALLNDSLVDALTTDSAGPYSTWCVDSLDSSPSTRARWDLFQWG